MSRHLSLSAVLAIALLAMGCFSRNFDSDTSKPAPVEQPDSSGSSAADSAGEDGNRTRADGISFVAPSGWTAETPPNTMRRFQYRMPRAEGDAEDGEMVVFFFGRGQGGGVDENLKRWIGQFTLADGSPADSAAQTSKRTSNGIPITILSLKGTYMRSVGGPMSGRTEPKPGFGMFAAVAETSAGSYYFKATGPESTIDRWAGDWDRMLDSIGP